MHSHIYIRIYAFSRREKTKTFWITMAITVRQVWPVWRPKTFRGLTKNCHVRTDERTSGHSSCAVRFYSGFSRPRGKKTAKLKRSGFFKFIFYLFIFVFCFWANIHSPVDSGTPWPPWTSSPGTRTSCTPRPPDRRRNVRPSARCASSPGVCAADTCASNSTPTVGKRKPNGKQCAICYFAEREPEISRLSPSYPRNRTRIASKTLSLRLYHTRAVNQLPRL